MGTVVSRDATLNTGRQAHRGLLISRTVREQTGMPFNHRCVAIPSVDKSSHRSALSQARTEKLKAGMGGISVT